MKFIKKFVGSIILLATIFQFITVQYTFANINIVDQPKNVQIPSVCEWQIQEEEKPKEFETNVLKYAKAENFLREACNYFKMAEEAAPSLIQDYNKIIENTDPLKKCNPLGNCFANCNLKGPKINVKIDITVLVCDAVATVMGAPGGCTTLFSTAEYTELINIVYTILNGFTFLKNHASEIQNIVSAFNNLATSTTEFWKLAYILKEQLANVINSGIISEIISGKPADPNATSTILQQFFNNMATLEEEKITAQEKTNLLKGRIYEMEYLVKLNLVSFLKIQNQDYQNFIVLFQQISSLSSQLMQTIENHSRWKELFIPKSIGPAYFTILSGKISNTLEKFPATATTSNFALISKFSFNEMEKFNFQENIDILRQIIDKINNFLQNPQSISETEKEELISFKNTLSDFKENLSQLKNSFVHIKSIAINVSKEEVAPSYYFTKLRSPFEKILEPENLDKISFLNDSLSSLLDLLQDPNNGLLPEQITSTTLALFEIQDTASNLEISFSSLYSYYLEALEKNVISVLADTKEELLKVRDDIENTSQKFFNFLTTFDDVLQSISTTTTTTLESDPQNPLTFKEAVNKEIENIKTILDPANQETLVFEIKNLGKNLEEISQEIQNNFGLDLKEYDNLLESALSNIENKIYETLGEQTPSTNSGSLITIPFEKTDNEEKTITSQQYTAIPWTKIKSIQIPTYATSISPLQIRFRVWSSDDAVIAFWGRTNAKAKIRKNGVDVTGEITSCNNLKTAGCQQLDYTTTTRGWQAGDNIELWIQKDDSGAAFEYISTDVFEVNGTISFYPLKFSLFSLLSAIKSNSWKDVYNCSRYQARNCDEDQNPNCYITWGDLYQLTKDAYQKIKRGNPTSTRIAFLEELEAIQNVVGFCNGKNAVPNSICASYNSLYNKIDNSVFNDFNKGKISKLIFALATTSNDIINFQNKINGLMTTLDNFEKKISYSDLTTKNEVIPLIERMKIKIINNSIDIGNFEENVNFLKNLPLVNGDLNNLGKLYQTTEKLEDTIKNENGIEKIMEEIDNFNVGVTSTIISIRNNIDSIASKILKFQTNFRIGILTGISFPPNQQGWMARWNYLSWDNNNTCTWPYPVERDKITCCLPENFESNLGESRWTNDLNCGQNEVITAINWPNAVSGCISCSIFGPYRDWTGCWDSGGKLRCTKILNSSIGGEDNETSETCTVDTFMTAIRWPECKQVCILGPSASRSWGSSGRCNCNSIWWCSLCCSFNNCTTPEGCNRCSGSFEPNYVSCGKIYSQGKQIKYSDEICYDLATICQNLLDRANRFKCFETGDSTISFGTSTVTISSSTKMVFCPNLLAEINRLGCKNSAIGKTKVTKCDITIKRNCFESYDTTCGDIDFYQQLLNYGIESSYLADMQYLPSKIKENLTKIENTSLPILNTMSLIGILETTALLYQQGKTIFANVGVLTNTIPNLVTAFNNEVINNNFNPSNLINVNPISIEIENGEIFRCESLPPKNKYQQEGQNYNSVCAPTKDLAKKATDDFSKIRRLVRRVIWIRDKNRITNTLSSAIDKVTNPDTNKIELLAQKADEELRMKSALVWAYSLSLGEAIAPHCACGANSSLCDITYCLPNAIDLFYPLLKNILSQIKDVLGNPDWLTDALNSNNFDCDERLWKQDFVQNALTEAAKTILKFTYNKADFSSEEEYNNFINQKASEEVEEITNNLIGPRTGVCEIVGSIDHFINPYCVTSWILHYLGKGLQIQKPLEDFIYNGARDIK